MKKSITVIGKIVDYVYIIRDIKIGEITLDKYSVECRNNIVSTWESVEEQTTSPGQNQDNRTFEIILKDKVSTVTFYAKGNVIEMVAKMGGKIIRDIKVEKGKGKSQKVYLINIELFKEVNKE
jgi:hypothetical protein